MQIAESNYLESENLERLGNDEDETGTAGVDYEWVAETLKTLFVTKLEGGTEPYLIMKRYNDGDGLAGYAEVVRYYIKTEKTGRTHRQDQRTDLQHHWDQKHSSDVPP